MSSKFSPLVGGRVGPINGQPSPIRCFSKNHSASCCEQIITMIGRVIAENSPADPTNAVDVIAVEVNGAGRFVDSDGAVVKDKQLILKRTGLRCRNKRAVRGIQSRR